MNIDRFKAVFSGLDSAYGTYLIDKVRHDGKQAGKAMVIRKPVTDDLWEKHLQGVEPSLGIIPIRSDNTCTWGCIDIDEYPMDHQALVHKIASLKLPLVVFRSKSGGAHAFLFVKTPVPASDMRKCLGEIAALIGEAGKEIFPKQSEILVERGDTGNFLNLPYHGGDQTLRYAIKGDGTAATLEEFYEMHALKVQEALPEILGPAPKPDQPIKDGPPCLQALCAQGFPEGTRNNGLFNIGIYLKRSHPHGWEDKMMEYNQKYFDPPLGLQEFQLLVRQHAKKEYKYKCKDAPINAFCNASLCRTRRYGIGADGPDAPKMSSLSKYNSDPPLWFLDVNGRRLELDTESLYNQVGFQKACVERLNLLPPTLRKQDWEQMLNALLQQMVELEQIQEAPVDTTVGGRFIDLLEEFTTHMQQAMDRDEMLLGRPWMDEEEGFVYFRIKDLEDYLSRNNFKGLTAPKMAQRLRDLGGEPLSLFLKGRTVRAWKIPCFPKQNEKFSIPDQRKKSPF